MAGALVLTRPSCLTNLGLLGFLFRYPQVGGPAILAIAMLESQRSSKVEYSHSGSRFTLHHSGSALVARHEMQDRRGSEGESV